ncbi:unnamed protein product [Kuraishia capsulata CBS 1993]|uniref:RING-type domain-containing protein n=1 Tax=Kuraishia capsulata CBS 1993 TaxID=1382522 RepID=W6MFD2_9ASCO|nr:uncharacterized protein KUCA_T00000447001 [Kuraishia capsulata CBS 1993]CDK24484.1 unnamed protein product [Kuraishia capsulata CBS 1993]
MIPTGFYTLAFDIFPTESLVLRGNAVADYYADTLQYKNQLNHPKLKEGNRDKWVQKVIESSDLFTELQSEEPELSLVSEESVGEGYQKVVLDTDKDYRFANIEVTPVDMTSAGTRSAEPIKARLIGSGVIRLYREWNNTDSATIDYDDENEDPDSSVVDGDTTMVSLVAVPSYFTATDLLGFVGENARQNVSHFRLIRSQTPNRFMVLMKFRDETNANLFLEEYNGKNFNSMEPETCSVIKVNRVLFRSHSGSTKNTASDSKGSTSLPFLLQDPFTTPSPIQTEALSKPLPPPQLVLTELPTCPVCLERMDASVTGLLTIPCQHTFHCQCLSKWRDDSCPVCRYTSRFEKFKGDGDEQEQCTECHSTENLWMCLICGNVGCSRYDSAHAVDHFDRTAHCFALDINSQRVWDYAGDNYVHRLLQNMSDGKLVELPSRDEKVKGDSAVAGSSNGSSDHAKHEKITLEYTKLLTSQLESQREYFESVLSRRTETVEAKIEQLEQRHSDYEEELSKTKARLEKYQSLTNEFRNKYVHEKVLSKALSEKIDFLEKEKTELKKSNEDLQEQVNDVMFYLKAQETFKDADEDVKEGQIVMKESAKSKKKGRSKR